LVKKWVILTHFGGNPELRETFREFSENFREFSETFREFSETFREFSETFRELSENFREFTGTFGGVRNEVSAAFYRFYAGRRSAPNKFGTVNASGGAAVA
jgi:hypothetical protein